MPVADLAKLKETRDVKVYFKLVNHCSRVETLSMRSGLVKLSEFIERGQTEKR